MAEIKRKPVVYTYGPEGRDACWAALTKSWNELARRQKSSSSDELTAPWTTTTGAQETNEIDSTTPPRGTVAAPEMATTPPPPPMMRSPPRLERRTAGGGPHHRRRSHCNEWDTPKGHCDGAADDSFRPYDLSDLLQECLRPSPDMAAPADSCCDRDRRGYRSRFDWNDDVAAAAAVAQPVREQRRPPSSRADDGDGTPFMFGIEEAPNAVSTAAADDEDEEEDEAMTITLVEDVAAAAVPVVQDEVTATATVVQDQDKATTTVIQDVATATAPVVQDEVTATAPVVEDVTRDATDPTRSTGAAVDEARDELQTVDNPSQPPPPLPWTAGYRETRIQEIDDNIVSYSKSLLITVLVVVLIRVLF